MSSRQLASISARMIRARQTSFNGTSRNGPPCCHQEAIGILPPLALIAIGELAAYGVWVRPITYRDEVRSQALAPEKSARPSHRASGGTAQNNLCVGAHGNRAHWTRSVY
jgi:hypothetical protein